jgi:hypothetical protein
VRVVAGPRRKFVGIFVGIIGSLHIKSIDISVCYDISEVPLLAPSRKFDSDFASVLPQIVPLDVSAGHDSVLVCYRVSSMCIAALASRG